MVERDGDPCPGYGAATTPEFVSAPRCRRDAMETQCPGDGPATPPEFGQRSEMSSRWRGQTAWTTSIPELGSAAGWAEGTVCAGGGVRLVSETVGRVSWYVA